MCVIIMLAWKDLLFLNWNKRPRFIVVWALTKNAPNWDFHYDSLFLYTEHYHFQMLLLQVKRHILRRGQKTKMDFLAKKSLLILWVAIFSHQKDGLQQYSKHVFECFVIGTWRSGFQHVYSGPLRGLLFYPRSLFSRYELFVQIHSSVLWYLLSIIKISNWW